MHSSPVQAPYLVIDDFMSSAVAKEMRAAIEARLGNPYRKSPGPQMDWEYWHVPDMYTYLRTLPERVIGPRLTAIFNDHLLKWSTETLGLAGVRASLLSLYVSGCRQNQHNDSTNGRFGFVYSLTKDSRRTSGGQTLIWREDDYFKTRIHRPSAGSDFFQSIEPRFNRLLVFDDHIPHAVQLVEGNMDPLEGRVVIHGHIREAGPVVSGPLPRAVVVEIGNRLASAYAADLGNTMMIYHGPTAVRFLVLPDGTVTGAHLILNRVKRLRGEGPTVEQLLAELLNRISSAPFPVSAGQTVITFPFGFG